MSWVAVGVGGATLVSGYLGSRSASRATDASVASSRQAIEEQRAAREAFEERTEPFRQIGLAAAAPLLASLGIQLPQEAIPGGEAGNVDTSGARSAQEILDANDALERRLQQARRERTSLLGVAPRAAQVQMRRGETRALDAEIRSLESQIQSNIDLADSVRRAPTPPAQQPSAQQPSAQPQGGQRFLPLLEEVNPLVSFLRDQGFEDIQESAAARGQLRSGGTLRDLTEFNTQLASTVVPQLQQQRFNQLFNVLGIGQNAATGQGTAALNTASNIGNLLGNIGQAQAQGALAQGQVQQGVVSDLAGIGGLFAARNAPATSSLQGAQVTQNVTPQTLNNFSSIA